MDSSTKRLVNTGLNLVSMIAFAVPGGAPVGVAVLVVMAFFDAFTGEPPAKNPAITRGELKDAIADVQAKIMASFWKSDTDDMTEEVLALHQSFLEISAAVSMIKMDGDRFEFLTNNDTVKHFVAFGDRYFDMTTAQMPDGILDKLGDFRARLELSAQTGPQAAHMSADQVLEHQVLTMGLYCLVGSLTASYLKTAVLWNWGQEMLAAWQYEQCWKDLAAWNAMSQQDQSDNPDLDPAPKYTPEILASCLWNQYSADLAAWKAMTPAQQAHNPDLDPAKKYPLTAAQPANIYAPPTWEGWTTETSGHPPVTTKQKNCCANILSNNIQEMLDYCVGTPSSPGYYTTLLNHLNDLESKASAGEASLPSGAIAASIRGQDMLSAADQGAYAAGALEFLAAKYGLADVDGDDILAFGKALDEWRSAQASVNFGTHLVAQGETLLEIAGDAPAYKNLDTKTYAQKLFDNNPNLKFDASPGGVAVALTPRQTVKIFKPEAYAYLPLPATQGAGQ